jgi:hypothetical protein
VRIWNLQLPLDTGGEDGDNEKERSGDDHRSQLVQISR